jgi:2-methylcitrate dehydratase PrpD
VGVTALTLPAVSKDRPPASGNEARFHLEYCVALAAIGEDTILPEHSTDFASQIQTLKVRATMAKVKVFADPDQAHYHQCRVSVHDAQRRELASKAGKSPKGSPQNPMTDEEVIAKFTRLVRHRVAGAALDEYIGRALNLSQHDRWDWLVASFDKTS